MNIFTKTISVFLLAFAFSVPASLYAAEVFFASKNTSFAPGDEFLVNVFLNTEDESVNAIEGKITFPPDLLESREIRDGNSTINLWIEKPKSYTLNSKSYISFSGVTPGGFSGSKEPLFSVVFRTKKEGNGLIGAEGLRVLRNDGEGTEVKSAAKNFEFSILNLGKLQPENHIPDAALQMPEDTEPPEDFKISLMGDPNMFGGQQVLVFATTDKGSGIDHYEVREGLWGWFSVAESPYLLKHQWLDKEVFVKAVDKAGNERIATLIPPQQAPPSQPYGIFAVILALTIATILILKKLWKKIRR